MDDKNRKKPRAPGFYYAFLMLVIVCVMVIIPYVKWNVTMAAMFFICWLIVIPMCMRLGYTYQELYQSAIDNSSKALGSAFIIMAMGGMISAMIACGAVPTVVYYGLKFINPNIFLLCAFFVSFIYATITGSNWGTMGTVGVAFMLVGAGLGIPAGMTAGAVISASCLGDGSSPVSDSPNLAAAVFQIDLFAYCKKLYKVVIPAVIINCIIYLLLGLNHGGNIYDPSAVNQITTTLASNFNLDIFTLLPIIILLVLLILQKPALFTLLLSAVSAIAVAVVHQHVPLGAALKIFWSGYSSNTGVDIVDSLISRGGVASLLASVALFLITFGLIGVMQYVHITDVVIKPLVNRVKTKVGMVLATFTMGFAGNVIGCSGTFSTLINGALMPPLYKKMKYSKMTMARNLGAVVLPMSALIPWHINSVMAFDILGVSIGKYAPFLITAFTMPIVCFIVAMLNIDMEKTDTAECLNTDMENTDAAESGKQS